MLGKTISHYEILEKIGEGGMGVVYKARDLKLDRLVVLKFLPSHFSSDDEANKRFINEAKAASSLQHNNICTIHNVGETDDNQVFICMEYYNGETLDRIIKKGTIEINTALDLIFQILDGLNAAHKKGIMHRDVKPSNILLTEDGIVKILDFGLAKISGADQITQLGSTAGTTAYMSPEQLLGNEVDYRSDIWSVGVVFYEIITGSRPFKGEYEQAVSYSIVNDDPDWDIITDCGINPGLINILEKCLKKKPENRYRSINELLEDYKFPGSPERFSHLKTNPEMPSRIISRIAGKFKSNNLNVYLIFILMLILLVLYNTFQKPAPVEYDHVALLPINYTGNNPDEKKLVFGLFEYLTGQIGKIRNSERKLSVVPSSEIRAENVSSIKQARSLFNINLAIEATINFYDNYIQATVNIIDANEMKLVDSSTLQDSTNNIINFQSDIAVEIAAMLKIGSADIENVLLTGKTSQPQAFENYLKGKSFLMDYESIDNINEALKYFGKSVTSDTSYALAYAGLAEAYYRKFENEKKIQYADSATRYCYMALGLNSELAESHITLGMIHGIKGLYKEAVSDFENAIEIDVSNHVAYRELAHIYSKMDIPELAELTYKRAIKLNPEYWDNYNYLGIFYFQLGDYEKAKNQFKKVIELRPNNIKGYNNLGGMYFYLDKLDSSIIAFNKSIDIEPNLEGYYQLGAFYFYQQQYAEAAEMFLSATEFSEEDYSLWGNLAESYYWSGRQDKAAEYYKLAVLHCEQRLDVNPKDTYIIADLAGYHAMLGNNEKALNLLNRSIRYGNLQPGVMFTIGAVYEQIGNRDKAVEWIARAVYGGYSLSEIELYPGLADLRKDEKYISLVNSVSTAL
jgi:serine/threonine-protein kinase